MKKYQNKSIRDPIERNARDPVRTLSEFERLLGPIHLCKQEGLPHDTLLIGVVAALRYPEAQMMGKLFLDIAEKKLNSLLGKESI